MPYLIPLEDLAEMMQKSAVKAEIRRDEEKFLFYSGANRQIILNAIRREFTKKETITEMEKRIVTINIMKKIIDKLAQVYSRAPKRASANDEAEDNELLADMEQAMSFNQRMKEMNRGLKRDKRALMEFFPFQGKPQCRFHPAHTYRVFSATAENPAAFDVLVQIIDKDTYRYWDDTQMVDFNKKGIPDGDPISLVNGMGTKPFEYINEVTYSTQPIQSDDLLDMSTCIPIVLTDMLFGLKFQCWSIIYTIGAKGKFTANPNTILDLDFGEDGQMPKIDTVKPNMDVDKLLSAVVFLIELLLTTNNLKAGEVQVEVSNAISGISKLLDSAETVENREDQEEYFQSAERNIWEFKLAKQLMPYWRKTKEVIGDFDREFSDKFKLSLIYQEPGILLTEEQKVDVAKKKIDARMTTRKREIKKLNPEMSDSEVDKLLQEIDEETAASQVSGSGVPAEDGGDDGVEPDVQD